VSSPREATLKPSAAERLKELEKLKSESLVTEDEYRTKRKQILDEI